MSNNKFVPIGISGLKQSGKNTVGDFIIKHHNLTCVPASFAEPIREISKLFKFTEHQIHTDKDEINNTWCMSWRKFAQLFGTDLMRDTFDKEVWLKLARQLIKDNSTKICVFTDVRFPNEAKMIRDLGGYTFLVNRPDLKREDPHSSELGILTSQVDFVINNDGNLTELEMATVRLMKKLDWYKPSSTFEKLIKVACSCMNCAGKEKK